MKNLLLALTLTIALLVSGAQAVSASSSPYIVKMGDTLYQTSKISNETKKGSTSSSTYTVKKGDTLFKISKMHNTTVTNIKLSNNLQSNVILPNQKLSIVSNAKASRKSTAAAKKSTSTVVAKKPSSKKLASKIVSRSTATNVVKEFTVTATAYTAYCNGCSGITKTGINLRENSNLKVIAVDPNVIKLGTKVFVEGYGYAIAGDTGGAIKGNKIDVFIPTKTEAFKWGRKTVKISIIE